MGQLLGSPLPQESAFATNLLVNFFDGGPRTLVEYRIGPRDPVKMERVVRPDPFIEEEFARNEATKRPWVKARTLIAYLGGAPATRTRTGYSSHGGACNR